MDPKNPKRLGVGDRATELLLDEPTFEALAALLRSKQFDRVRPARPADKPFDPLDVVRDEGPTLVQSFQESTAQRGGKFDAILADICAFANTAGGVVYVGAKPGKDKLRGITSPAQVEQDIRKAIGERMTPQLEAKIDVMQSQSAKILRVQVSKGLDIPYALDDNKFYVRDEAETSLAVRDEIVALVREALGFDPIMTKPRRPLSLKRRQNPPRKMSAGSRIIVATARRPRTAPPRRASLSPQPTKARRRRSRPTMQPFIYRKWVSRLSTATSATATVSTRFATCATVT
ncbi:MAG: ATP-binding protein [Anaerolineales bacterium]|nr:ATP-binding protein [Anaerolineales bacterium]